MDLPSPGPADGRRGVDWEADRERMVRRQLEARGIVDPGVLRAFRLVPRHEFVPSSQQHMAYEDTPLPIGRGQTISQPYMVAIMTEALRLRGGERVLEVGTGSGYQAAILAEMGCEVHTVERDPVLADEAEGRLLRLGYLGVKVHRGDGTRGLPDQAPFQGVVVTAGGPRVPASLQEQLGAGGVLVIPVGDRGSQDLLRVTRTRDGFREENLGGCRFVPLVGEEGW